MTDLIPHMMQILIWLSGLTLIGMGMGRSRMRERKLEIELELEDEDAGTEGPSPHESRDDQSA